MIKVIIADDQVILRESIKELIEKDENIIVIGTVSDGKSAYELCRRTMPDLVLMDIRMPGCDGIEGTKLIKEKYPDIKIIILTTFEDEEYISKALSYGAEGYILKDVSPDMLISAVNSVVNGLPVIHIKTIGTILKKMQKKEREKKKRCFIEGKSNKENADKVHLSEGRIRNIITEVFIKLGVKDRTQLAVYSVRNDII